MVHHFRPRPPADPCSNFAPRKVHPSMGIQAWKSTIWRRSESARKSHSFLFIFTRLRAAADFDRAVVENGRTRRCHEMGMDRRGEVGFWCTISVLGLRRTRAPVLLPEKSTLPCGWRPRTAPFGDVLRLRENHMLSSAFSPDFAQLLILTGR